MNTTVRVMRPCECALNTDQNGFYMDKSIRFTDDCLLQTKTAIFCPFNETGASLFVKCPLKVLLIILL